MLAMSALYTPPVTASSQVGTEPHPTEAKGPSFCESFRESDRNNRGYRPRDAAEVVVPAGADVFPPFEVDHGSFEVIDDYRAEIDLLLYTPVLPLTPDEACRQPIPDPVIFPMNREDLLAEQAKRTPSPSAPLQFRLEMQWPNCWPEQAPKLVIRAGGTEQLVEVPNRPKHCHGTDGRFFLVPQPPIVTTGLNPIAKRPDEGALGLPGSYLPRRIPSAGSGKDLMAEYEIRPVAAGGEPVFRRDFSNPAGLLAALGDVPSDVPHEIRVRFFRNVHSREKRVFDASAWSDPAIFVRPPRPRGELRTCEKSLPLLWWPWGARVPEGEPKPVTTGKKRGHRVVSVRPVSAREELRPWLDQLRDEGCLLEHKFFGFPEDQILEFVKESRITVEGHGIYLPVSGRVRVEYEARGYEKFPRTLVFVDGVHPYPYPYPNPAGTGSLRLPEETILEILESEERAGKIQLIADPNTDPAILWQLAHDGFLREVVGRVEKDVFFLLRLLGTVDERERRQIARHPGAFPEQVLRSLALDPDEEVRWTLACGRQGLLPESILDIQRRSKSLRRCVDERIREGGRMDQFCRGFPSIPLFVLEDPEN